MKTRDADKTEKTRILAIDDEEPIRRLLTQWLTYLGYDCEAAKNVAAATVLLERQDFDLVILDNLMPGETGLQFLPRLVGARPNVAVLTLTGSGDVPGAVKAMEEGAYDYIPKPIALDSLDYRIRRALEKRDQSNLHREYVESLEPLCASLSEEIVTLESQLGALSSFVRTRENQMEQVVEELGRLEEMMDKLDAASSQAES